MIRSLGLGVVVVVLWSPARRCLAAPEPNSCHEAQRLHRWQELLATYPEDQELQALQAVWADWCLQVT